VLRVGAYVLAWLMVAVPAAVILFLTAEATTTVASHDAVVRPTLDGQVTLRTGPFLPDVRTVSGERFGVEIALGKTEAGSTEELVERYAFIASQPDAQIERVGDTVREMAYDAAVRGALLGLVAPVLWVLVGARRRRELLRGLGTGRGVAVVIGGSALALTAGLLLRSPWDAPPATVADDAEWFRLGEYLPEIDIPAEAADIEVAGGATTRGGRRLVLSAVDTYQRSRTFYQGARERAAELELRQPEEGETVALLVSDRHDNIGMDPVARAVADQAGATAILDAGDDTSTGSAWEAFSLDSLDETFQDYGDQRWAVAGNHDNGTFVSRYLADRGWVTAQQEPVEGPGGGVLLSWDDPRSSGLGTWRDSTGLSIGETAERIADVACASEERVNTLLVHDSNMGDETLERGCADLVVAGHLHVRVGPDPVLGENGETGFAYTSGTTGGAAYALAVGSKLRRAAEMTLITYRAGRPVGMQGVLLQTNGVFVVDEYVGLDYGAEVAEAAGRTPQP
jgi:predicted phosphodiesterase